MAQRARAVDSGRQSKRARRRWDELDGRREKGGRAAAAVVGEREARGVSASQQRRRATRAAQEGRARCRRR